MLKYTLGVDVVVVGGGIAGVWLHKLAQQLGYQSLLLSNEAIGSGQTIHAQGIIHGGVKYSLKGAITNSTLTIKQMPQRWRDCLTGKRSAGTYNTNLDLSGVRLLSQHHYLWTTRNWRSTVSTLLASALLDAQATPCQAVPLPFADRYNNLYQLNEFIIDIPHLLEHLLDAQSMKRATVDTQDIVHNQDGTITIACNDTNIQTNALVLAAGEGNQRLIANRQNTSAIATQVRPLHMLAVCDAHLPTVFAHAIEMDSVPRLTITSHPNSAQQPVWYLGGKLAEQGVNKTHEQLVRMAHKEIATLLPAFHFVKPKWCSIRINRAEQQQSKLIRPTGASMAQVASNTLVVWPTKLTCAPQLGDMFAHWLVAHQQPTATPIDQSALCALAPQQVATSAYNRLHA